MIRPANLSLLKLSVLVTAALFLAAAPAQARRHSAPKPDAEQDAPPKKGAAKETSAKQQQVASFGDWGAYATPRAARPRSATRSPQPKDRAPARPQEARQAYIFISARPGREREERDFR